MPIYSYTCDHCEDDHEAYHPCDLMDAPTLCPNCGRIMHRNAIGRSAPSVRGQYKKPLELQSMGFLAHPDDVAEHRKRHPNVELVMHEGSAIPVVRSLGEKRAYLKAAGWADTRSF
jgi:putative FmdB family regulatory protein